MLCATAFLQAVHVNEFAYRILYRAQEAGCPVADAPTELLRSAEADAREFVSRFRQYEGAVAPPLSTLEVNDGKQLATRLTTMLLRQGEGVPSFSPAFSGCGWVDACTGDSLLGSCLVELKCGLRPFRQTDIRQLLTCAALDHACGDPIVDTVCLINGRSGLAFSIGLNELCIQLGGEASVSVLGDIVQYILSDWSVY